jgi:hypothetical protein
MCPGDLETLRCALTRCRSSLQSLELDLGNCFQEGPNEEEENMREVRKLFSEKLLGYSPSAMVSAFPPSEISVLSTGISPLPRMNFMML